MKGLGVSPPFRKFSLPRPCSLTIGPVLAILALLALAAQDDPAALVERLRSDRVEERDDAARRLKTLGAVALPALEKASKDPEPEVADRAKFLVRAIGALGRLSPTLRRIVPGAEDAVAAGRAWTEILLEAVGRDEKETLRPADLEPLIAPALQEARSEDDLTRIALIAKLRRLQGAGRLFAPYLDHDDRDIRSAAASTLRSLLPEDAVPDLVTLLENPREQTRWEAASLLGELTSPAAREAVRKAAGHKDPTVCILALKAIQMRDAKEAASVSVPFLRDPRDTVRQTAVSIVGLAGYREAAAEVIRLLDDKDPLVVASAALASARLGARESAPRLVALLDCPEPEIVTGAAIALTMLGVRDAAPRIAKLLGHPNLRVRREAAEALGALGTPSQAPLLLPLLDDSDAEVRKTAVAALARFREKTALPSLIRLLQDGNAEVAREAVAAIGAIGADDALPRLVKLMEGPEREGGLQNAATMALIRLRNPEAADRVLPFLASEVSEVRERAAKVVLAYRLKESVAGVARLIEHADDGVRGTAAGVLLDMAPWEALPQARAALKHANPQVRVTGLELLVNWLGEEAIPELSALLADPDAGVVAAAAGCLKYYPAARAALLPLLRRPDDDLRKIVAESLCSLDHLPETRDLQALLGDANPDVRTAALMFVREACFRDAAKEVLALLDDRDDGVAINAVFAAEVLGLQEARPRLLEHIQSDRLGLAAAALMVLASMKAPELGERLPGLLKHRDADVRGEAGKAVLALRKKGLYPGLVPLLQAKETRNYVIWYTVRAGGPEGIPLVLPFLDSPETRHDAIDALASPDALVQAPRIIPFLRDPEHAGTVAHVLEAMNAQGHLIDLIKAWDLERETLGGVYVPAILKLSKGADLAPVQAMLKDADAGVRHKALIVLRHAGPPGIEAAIAGMAADPVPAIRREVAEALGQRQARAHAGVLTSLLADRVAEVRYAAAGGLGWLEIREPLLPLVRDPDAAVRARAVELLSTLVDDGAIFLPLLDDPDEHVRKEATIALARLDVREAGPAILKSDGWPYVRAYALGRLGVRDARAAIAEIGIADRSRDQATTGGALCRLGFREGIPGVFILMDGDLDLFALNALRQPELWERLRERRLGADLEGTGREILERIARAADLKLKIDPGVEEVLKQGGRVRCRGGRTALLFALESLCGRGLEIVLEADAVRIRTPEAADADWRRWCRETELPAQRR